MQGGAGGRSPPGGGSGGAQPPQDSIPTHIWDTGWDWDIWDIGLGLGYLGYRFWDWVIWDIGFGIWVIWDIGFGIWVLLIRSFINTWVGLNLLKFAKI